MRILIFHPYVAERLYDISYENLYTKCGYSGTDNSMMELANHLVKKGHWVCIIGSVKQELQTGAGIIMVPYENRMIEKHDLLNVDVFCPLFFIYQAIPFLNVLNPRRTLIWIALHCMLEERILKPISERFYTIYQCVSPYVMKHYSFVERDKIRVIYNGIPELYSEDVATTPEKKRGHWVFFASYERGGDIALQVFGKVKEKMPEIAQKMHLATYYTPQILDIEQKCIQREDIVSHGSLSKIQLRDLLDGCDYFVYPLVLPNSCVHHDTFGCVILEAMARGVIVVTWDVACIPEIYGDMIIQVPHIPKEGYDPYGVTGKNGNFLSKEAIEKLRDAIMELEKDPERKEKIRRRAMEWAHTRLWSVEGERMERFLIDSKGELEKF